MRSMTLSSVASLMVRACAGVQVVVEHQHRRVVLQRARHQLLDLALADEVARIDLLPLLRDHVEHAHAGGAAQLLELGQARVRLLDA